MFLVDRVWLCRSSLQSLASPFNLFTLLSDLPFTCAIGALIFLFTRPIFSRTSFLLALGPYMQAIGPSVLGWD